MARQKAPQIRIKLENTSQMNRLRLCGKYLTMDDVGDGAVFARSVAEPQLFTIIFDRYYRSVHGYLSRRVGSTVADDLAAETFTRAFERRARYDSGAARALPWLLGIAINLLAHHRRSEARQLRALAAAREPESDTFADAASGRIDAGASRARLAAALEQLDEYDREALLLYAWAELKYEEVAEALGIPVGTVRSRLHRSRQKLRQALEEEWAENVIGLRREAAGRG
jgi:RNA polymerase sigma factor (sigma-70 family)